MAGIAVAFIIACASMLVGGIAGAHDGFKGGEIAAQKGDKTYIVIDDKVYHAEEELQAADE
jgi:hypothetical protein